MSGVLLDTCALIWTLEEANILEASKVQITKHAQNGKLFVSPISAWEVGLLASKRRISLNMSVEKWFNQVVESPFFTMAELSPSILIQSTDLPATPPNDPVDRMMIAMARANGLSLMTRDKQILKYGQMGHVLTIEC